MRASAANTAEQASAAATALAQSQQAIALALANGAAADADAVKQLLGSSEALSCSCTGERDAKRVVC
jgi:hypothetical protein